MDLPKKQLAAGALFFNSQEEILIVKPIYRDHWLIPGGIVEEWESPKAACLREVKEELGLEVRIGELVCLDYQVKNTADLGQRENIQIIFDGGTLSESQIAEISLQKDEIEACDFVTIDQALSKLSPGLKKRIPPAIRARLSQKCAYLENGLA